MKKIVQWSIPVATLLLCQCYSKSVSPENTVSAYPVVTLKAIDTTLEKEYVTQIQSVKNVEIRSPANGLIQKIFVDEGQQVKEGQVLFQLNAARYQTDVNKASALVGSALAEAGAAAVEVRRVKILADKNVISKTELELAEAKYNVAQAKVAEAKASEANARLLLSYTAIRAPFSGVINRIPLKIGSLVEEGSLLTTLSDLQSVYAYFNLSEKEYLQFMQAQKADSARHADEVTLLMANGKRFDSKGHIETMESEINQNTGALAFRARFTNSNGLLKHGSTGKILLSTGTTGVVAVPQKSVFEVQDKNYVYIVDAQNKVAIRNIIPAVRLGNNYLVREGLQEGDRIIYEGNQTIREGQQIKPLPVTSDTP